MQLIPSVDPEDARAELDRLVGASPSSYAALSRMIGRNAAYLQQYVRRGSPKFLEERDRKLLANFFGVDEARLGGMPSAAMRGELASIRKLDVRPSAGAGATVDTEGAIASYSFDRRWLRDLGHHRPEALSLVSVRGDSMTPTLADGDEIMVSAFEGGALSDGIYVLERDDALIVKRLSLNPSTGLLTISSDNAAYPSWSECPPDSIRIIGRVVWTMRKVA